MGFCREAVGRISIESRRESFVVHDDDLADEREEPDPLIFPAREDPEVDYRALDDLLAALQDLRLNDKSYAAWVAANPGKLLPQAPPKDVRDCDSCWEVAGEVLKVVPPHRTPPREDFCDLAQLIHNRHIAGWETGAGV